RSHRVPAVAGLVVYANPAALLPLPLPRSPAPLFFSYLDDHRDLRSFPTRRSSDLEVEAGDLRLVVGGATGEVVRRVQAQASSRRSEEHTSELQSRENLVCRLLLEKKNRQINPTCRSPTTRRRARSRTSIDSTRAAP